MCAQGLMLPGVFLSLVAPSHQAGEKVKSSL